MTNNVPAPNPTTSGAVLSLAIKAVLVALASLGWVPVSDGAIAEVTLAVGAVADALVYFGIIRPRVGELQRAAAASPAEVNQTV
ncbi:hypothetical protein AB0M54_30070 [Actinoplanes sp. NPDC051470]|uniref:hypothetical protein n=1 Tax=unclassified Actinoplanes TaxID=2626549 RepID=UPI003442F80B